MKLETPDGFGADTSLAARAAIDPEILALHSLLAAIFEQYNIDFRAYAISSLLRRVRSQVIEEKMTSIPELQERVLANPASLKRLITALTIHVTAMFRDPRFYNALRQELIPVLRTYPFIRIWVAGCSTGEEVYSLAILLEEEGLYDRCRIYATDVSDVVLARAKQGIYPLAAMREYSRNYQMAEGKEAFVGYYMADSQNAVLRPALRRNLIFAAHNLVGDASFNEFHVIFCRNVMIYFNRTLQERVHRLFFDSLLNFGYLGLGRSESIRFSPQENFYVPVSSRDKLYQKRA